MGTPGMKTPASPLWENVTSHLVSGASDGGGAIHVFMPGRNLLVSRVTGHLSVNLARIIPAALADHFALHGRVSMLHDWEAMTTYDSGARRLLTNWVLANIGSIISNEFLLGSRIVAMGVAAANLATSLAGLELVAYPSREKFDSALARALYTATRRAAA